MIVEPEKMPCIGMKYLLVSSVAKSLTDFGFTAAEVAKAKRLVLSNRQPVKVSFDPNVEPEVGGATGKGQYLASNTGLVNSTFVGCYFEHFRIIRDDATDSQCTISLFG